MSGADHKKIKPRSPSDYLAVMSRAVYQAGVSWAMIDRQWPALCGAFQQFDAKKIARYKDRDVRRIMAHPDILHSERKIRATIHNAQTLLELDRKHRGLRKYLRSFGSYEELVADIRRRFKSVGDISAYYLLFRTGEKVPSFERWIRSVQGDHPRIREMVAAARKA